MMNVKQWIPSVALAGLMLGGTVVPTMAFGQRNLEQELKHRQQSKNDWRNLGYVGGAVGLYGLLKGDKNLAMLGIGGGLYSAYRYEQDRKSQDKSAQKRAHLFSQRSFDHNGHHYVRHEVNKGGHKYYRFDRDDHRPGQGHKAHHDNGRHEG